ncbi:ROK family protein [Neptuniibacter sp.]|uniref:ROK family protein n=1 Tax=Neptuniibacter sp. TaxID=1962643 RepID=UPI002605C3C2|nr:ROK family protein [Neptuniibacter sp.]MCP4594951.1 ROK family protein [Neptuniibacter sp.]
MRIGIDLGGTKIEIIAIDESSNEIYRERVATPQDSYPKTVTALVQLIRDCEAKCNITATSIGIGIPGAISPASGLIKNANSTCLIGQRLDKDLEDQLDRQVKLANDADCFALSEATDGSGQNYNSVFGVILGTGVGGGIIINKQLLQGPNAICGEWGHNPLPWLCADDLPGRDCYCGKDDCIETFLSGPGFSKAYSLHNSVQRNAEGIWTAADEGSEQAVKFCNLYIEQLAKALASVINILDPEVIVLGGGLSNQDRIYSQIDAYLGKYVFSDRVTTPIMKATHGDSSGVRGAAWL